MYLASHMVRADDAMRKAHQLKAGFYMHLITFCCTLEVDRRHAKQCSIIISDGIHYDAMLLRRLQRAGGM